MTFSEFVSVFRALPKEITSISLANWSEPFLNKDIIKIIKFIKNERPDISIWVSSNGNIFTEDLPLQIVSSKLDWLEITISGLEEEIYQKYHRNGKLERVLHFIKGLTKAKRELNASTPFIEINYLLFPYNIADETDIKKALTKKLADENLIQYIDNISIIHGTLMGSQLGISEYSSHAQEIKSKYKHTTHYKYLCLLLFFNAAIRADGSVFPCCKVEYKEYLNLGNLFENSFLDIWNSKKFISFREDFLAGKNSECNNCFFEYSRIPLLSSNNLKLRIKLNSKLFFKKALKHSFLIDHYLFKDKYFKHWVNFRLKKKNKLP